MIEYAIRKAFDRMNDKEWDKIYVAVNIHGTIVRSNYKVGEIPTEFYPFSKKTLQLMSSRSDVCLIMYTCSHLGQIDKYLQFFQENNINFDYVNCNPEIQNTALGRYTDKLYFNILLEDKAGFDAESDWEDVLWSFNTYRNKLMKNND